MRQPQQGGQCNASQRWLSCLPPSGSARPLALCCAVPQGVDSGPELRAAGLSERFGLYLRTWQGALDLAAHPDMEFMAALELFRGASMVRGGG